VWRKALATGAGVPHDGNVVTETDVRELVRRWDGPVVTSLYLDVDGRRYPRPSDLAPRLRHLFDLARASAAAQGADATDAVHHDLRRIALWIERELDRTTTRGVAAFSCAARDRFAVFPLSGGVRDGVVVGPGPDVAQLCAWASRGRRTLVVAVDRQGGRMVRLDDGRIEERGVPVDATERRVDTGVEIGSFERRHEELARQHLRHVARAVADELEAWRADAVVLSGLEENLAQFERQLPDHVLALVQGRLRLPVATDPVDLARAAGEVVRAAERQRLDELVGELRGRSAQGASAVTGLGPVLEELGEGRVGTLLVEEGFDVPGIRCPDCGRLAPGGDSCPRCGSTPLAVEHVVEAAVHEAFAHHVTIEFVEPAGFEGLGRIGALGR